MIPTGIPVFLFGIFLLISGSHAFGLQTSSAVNHSDHHGDIIKEWISYFYAKRNDVDRNTVKDALAREIVGENAREKWKELGSKDPPIVTERDQGKSKIYTFQPDASMTVKEVFSLLKYFPLLFPKDKRITYRIIEIPVDGKTMALKIERRGGRYQLKSVYKDPNNPGKYLETNLRSDIGNVVDQLRSEPPTEPSPSPELHEALKEALAKTLPDIYNAKLNAAPVFEAELAKHDKGSEVTDTMKEKAFREAIEVMASSSILTTDLAAFNPPSWLQDVYENHLKTGREELDAKLEKEIKDAGKTKLRLELIASMLKTSQEVKDEWEKLKGTETSPGSGQMIIDQQMSAVDPNKVEEVTIRPTDQIELKKVFKMLQSFNDLFPNNGESDRIRFIIPIGGEERTIYLSRAPRGKHQIFVETQNRNWPDATERNKGEDYYPPSYDIMINKVLKEFPNHQNLAKTILEALDSKLNAQPNFQEDLKVTNTDDSPKVVETADAIRNTVELMVITMVAEAAQPSDLVKTKFIEHIAKTIRDKNKFPTKDEMPRLQKGLKEGREVLLEGRSPVMDEVARKILLEEVYRGGIQIHEAFTDANYPARQATDYDEEGNKRPKEAKGGAELAREYLYSEGDQLIPSYLITQQADSDHDRETVVKRAIKYCTSSKKRKKRAACSLEELNDEIIVDEKSIKVSKTKVELDVVDGRDAKKRMHLTLDITADELATPKSIKERLSNSKRSGASHKYAKVNKGLAVHGVVFSALGALDYFSRGDDVRGGFAVSQSLHTLGALTGVNEIAAKLGKKLLRYSAFKIAKGLKMEEGLARFSSKVDRFMEKGVGKLMGDIPGVGLVFDIYFIEQDVEALANLDLNNPDDVKLLPLRVVDLVLDVDTTVLNLIGTFCPEAEVITEPLIIVLSIVRMAIDDFYIDIMEEMDKVNWKSPWAGLEFIGALVKGFLEGAADFLSGGLRREMHSYQAQVDADRKLLSDLKNTDNYYKVVGCNGDECKIDFTQGHLSSFGSYINFRLHDDGQATLEIGDVTGKHETTKKTFSVPQNLDNIVLGVGESREFLYKTKTAKLWFFIPIKHYRVICGAKLHSKSLYGTYYGNSNKNKFYAVQNPKPTTPPSKPSSEGECNYGKINLKFLIGNYHYNLYGRGGDDVFYLGPQMSQVTGGQGSDVYVIQSDSGRTVIDNFAQDSKRDMVVINVPFDDISCLKSSSNLDLKYSSTHHIRVNNWFTPGNPNYYRHMSFRSLDGVIFVPKEIVPTNLDVETQVKCSAVALDKSSDKHKISTIDLQSANFREVKQVVGSDHADTISGNDLNNIIDGGKGADYLSGGRNEDTYIIRANEGCDIINNDADDFAKTTDVVVFDVKYSKIKIRINSDDSSLSVSDQDHELTTCFTVENWDLGERYQHMIFTSSDHVVFKVKTNIKVATKIPQILDYSSSTEGVTVDLSDSPSKGAIHDPGFDQVATVSDSKHNDHIVGNDQSNFLSCTGGSDFLKGGKGSDNYVVKETCQKVMINNYDRKQKVDLLLLDEKFENLALQKSNENVQIKSKFGSPVVVLYRWLRNTRYRHLWIRTKDGITVDINDEPLALHPVEISKDPKECQLKQSNCSPRAVLYDLRKAPWEKVTRFQLQGSSCSYRIRGNNLNNYIDPGPGNGYNYQVLEGRDGSDTYVLKHGYGEFNMIKNFARDKKTDILQLGLELNDIQFYFQGEHDAILTSKSRPSSLSVRILNYFKSPRHQHLQVVTSDKVAFEIQRKHPFMKVLTVDFSLSDSPVNISPVQNRVLSTAHSIQGSLTQKNSLTGTEETKEIKGGDEVDTLYGKSSKTIINGGGGNDEIHGDQGDDVLLGGEGDDSLYGGEGNDYFYGGNGRDLIDGGDGADTIAFKGDGSEKTGVHIDLSIGFGKGADAEGDIYKSIEHVYGSIHDDFLSGSDSNNNLYGRYGDDVILAHGGTDKLVGGEGKDIYILSKSWGIKVIDNFANDREEDTLYLIDVNVDDVCLFRIGNDLYLQTEKTTFSSVLYHGYQLTIVIQNWAVSSKYKHLNIVLKDVVWSSYVLQRVRRKFDELDTKVKHIATESNFKVVSFDGSSVQLSWNTLPGPPLDETTELLLMKLDTNNPKGMTTVDVGGQATVSVSSLDPASHYVFALFLRKCSATIATSFTLTTFGRRSSCPRISVQNAQATNEPALSVTHGTKTNIKCNSGFKMEDEYYYYDAGAHYEGVCIDSKWQPPLPSCHIIKHCPPDLIAPSNGQLTVKGQQEGSTACYVCNRGFKLDGVQERTCRADGEWEENDPRCLPIGCMKKPTIANGEFVPCDNNRPDIHGTFQDPREGYCLQLICQQFYFVSVEKKVVIQVERKSKILRSREIPRGGRVCAEGEWLGYTDATCKPVSRLSDEQEAWYSKSGILQILKNGGWEAAKQRDGSENLPCSAMSCVYGNPGRLSSKTLHVLPQSPNGIKVVCPKIRFVDTITPYEGKLEVLVKRRWERLCYDHYMTQNPQKEMKEICEVLGAETHQPSLVPQNIGMTGFILKCSDGKPL